LGKVGHRFIARYSDFQKDRNIFTLYRVAI
jgi:hypothetical protein